MLGKFLVITLVLISSSTLLRAQSSISTLAKAMTEENHAAILAAVKDAQRALGPKAGVPEEPDEYKPIPVKLKLLTKDDAQFGFSRDFAKLESMQTWKVGLDPTKLAYPLRAPASVLSGNVAAVRAAMDGADHCREIAQTAAEFLMWAQNQAGSGVFPFPAARGTSNARAMEAATRFLKNAERAGKLDAVVRNGWAYDDFGDGGLQFDNGECGIAMYEIYELTQDARYLESARRATEWAAARPLCTNWNYNSFSVELLAKAFEVTGEKRFLETAIHKARLGVIPGQLTEGPYAGRWFDPHNARPAYHYIMMRGLIRLVAAMPFSDSNHDEVLRSLTLGLTARNEEIITRGVMNKDKALEALLLADFYFKSDQDFLDRTRSIEALRIIGKMVSEEYRRGKHPLAPREWGLFLEAIKRGRIAL